MNERANLSLVPAEPESLDARIAAHMQDARDIWAGIGSYMLLFETRSDDTARFELCRELELRATDLSQVFDDLALLVEKREERA